MKLEINEQEAQVLINLINVAVMAKGLEAAESGLHFVNKIKEAAKPAKDDQNDEG